MKNQKDETEGSLMKTPKVEIDKVGEKETEERFKPIEKKEEERME